MPKFKSECGYEMNLSDIPCTFEYILLSEEKVEYLANKIEERDLDVDQFFEICDTNSAKVYKCPNCGNLYIEGTKGNFKVYRPSLV